MNKHKKNLYSLFFSFFILGLVNTWGQGPGFELTDTQLSEVVNGGQIIDIEEEGRLANPSNNDLDIDLSSDENCRLHLLLYVFVANEEFSWPPENGMYAEISFETYSHIFEITEFDYTWNNSFDVPISFTRMPINFSVDELCSSSLGATLSTNFNARLLESPDGGQTFRDFSFQDHINQGQLFECDNFHATCAAGWCGIENNCSNNPVNDFDLDGKFQMTCSAACGGDIVTEERGKEAPKKSVFSADFIPSVTPNPSTTHATLHYEIIQDTPVTFRVLDATGKVVRQSQDFREAGRHQKYLDTEAWPSGVYFVQIKVGNNIQHLRMVKI